MVIDEIQTHLENIYQLDRRANAQDFLIDGQTAERLGSLGNSDEELLVKEEEDSLDLALYLNPQLLSQLQAHPGGPAEAMVKDLSNYCQALEGVSHFVYLTHTASSERTVSLLELEAQAEVDKFASCVLLQFGKGPANWEEDIFSTLFEKVSYRKTLSADETFRYTEANRLAKNYCRSLLKHLKLGRLEGLISELRYQYRMGANAKLQRMASRL